MQSEHAYLGVCSQRRTKCGAHLLCTPKLARLHSPAGPLGGVPLASASSLHCISFWLTLGRPRAGMPPTWARKPGADAASLAALLEREYGSGEALAEVPMWRCKYLWFPADGSKRRPYYGSWSRARSAA